MGAADGADWNAMWPQLPGGSNGGSEGAKMHRADSATRTELNDYDTSDVEPVRWKTGVLSITAERTTERERAGASTRVECLGVR